LIKIGRHTFKYSKYQLPFLSNKAIQHFHRSELPFEIQYSNESDRFTFEDLLSCFKSIDSLLHSATEMEITENNLAAFEYLSNVLDNRYLLILCKKVTSDASQIFKFTSKNLQFISLDRLQKINDFKLIINGQIFEINYSLFCLVSDKIKEMNKGEEGLKISMPNEHFPCFVLLLDTCKGLPFYFENYSFGSLRI
jgi:hypothetical protein